MNSIRPISKSLFLLALLNVWSSASAQVATPPCNASFDVFDGDGNLLGSIPDDGPVLYVCNSDFLVLDFISTSTPSSGSTITASQWDLDGSNIFNVSAQYQFATDQELSVTLIINDLDLCSDMASAIIKVVGQPGFEADADQPTCFGLCDGSLSGTYLSDLASEYQHTWFLQGNEVGPGNFISSLCAGSYNVVVTDNGGCTDIDLPVVMGTPPAIEVSIAPPGPVSMCPGDNPLNLTATHLNAAEPLLSTAWSWPEELSDPNELITMFTPTSNNLNQTLDINIVDANGCEGSASIYLGARSASLFGTVEIDGEPCENCVIDLFKMGEAGAWSPYTGISTDATGLYEIGIAFGLTNTLIRMTAPEDEYPNLPPMYYPNTHNWAGSDVIFTGCDNAMNKIFSLSSPPQLSGSTTIEGGVYYQSSGKTESEDPIPGVDVVVEKVPPGNAMTVVTTDENGRFTFEYMEETLGDTLITFYVDLTGLPMVSNYLFTIGANDVLFEHVDFCVSEDTSEINACNLLSVSQLGDSEELSLSVFPNPANDLGRFKVQGSTANIAEVLLFDMTGRTVRNLRPDNSDFELNVHGLSEGIYTATVRLSDGKVLSERLMVGR